MKKITLLALLLIFSLFEGKSQITSIGHRTVTFNDPTRTTTGYGSGGGTGRQIQTEIYYPSSAAADGDSTAFATGQYPLLIFGHGFVMAWSSYDNIWKDLVPQGYIVCFPRTEGSTSPSHTDFGQDLALIQSKMLGLNTVSTSAFFNHVINKTAIMGHSMGGGSSFLACVGNTAPTTMVTFAAANTNPSSIVAATQVTIPTLVIAGQNDCIAPPPANQDSMYLKTAASCKAEITIKGAAHCEFANSSFACSFGEGTCSPQPTITSAQQHAIASVYYSYWLKYWLKGDCQSWNSFLDSANNATNITKQLSCNVTCSTTGIGKTEITSGVKIAPNPTQGLLNVSLENSSNITVEIYDALGRKVEMLYFTDTKDFTIDAAKFDRGVYYLVVKTPMADIKSVKFIKN
ncbi:MAG TPA: T9SS type A sorting domain-containing protein [Bacteroidia bacterium]|nr:T9SS type A sorting domain-containing protein [Bacteroidia bacterium]